MIEFEESIVVKNSDNIAMLNYVIRKVTKEENINVKASIKHGFREIKS